MLPWPEFILFWVGVLLTVWLASFLVKGQKLRRLISNLAPVAAIILCLAFGPHWSATERLAAASAVLLFVFKGAALLRQPLSFVRTMDWRGLVFYATAWPGMDPVPLAKVPEPAIEDHRRFAMGTGRAIVGVLGLLAVAWFGTPGSAWSQWLAIFFILLTVHMGLSDMLTEFAHAVGWPVKPLFDAPWRSESLTDFWSRRWNRPFVEMDRIFFLPWLSRRVGIRLALVGIFIISGLLHELAISYPAAVGWGGPLLYFAVQAAMVTLERRRKLGPAWVAVIVLGPIGLLFHGAFRTAIFRPLLEAMQQRLTNIGMPAMINALIIALGVAQFLVLFASFQVPTRLRWKEELPRLSTLNHKLMWTYGSFIVFTIVSFGIITLVLREDMLQGTRAGLAVATFIFMFWGFRLAIDTFYFRSSDWPRGPFMQMGHVMLNCLFLFVFCGYGAILLWHVTGR